METYQMVLHDRMTLSPGTTGDDLQNDTAVVKAVCKLMAATAVLVEGYMKSEDIVLEKSEVLDDTNSYGYNSHGSTVYGGTKNVRFTASIVPHNEPLVEILRRTKDVPASGNAPWRKVIFSWRPSEDVTTTLNTHTRIQLPQGTSCEEGVLDADYQAHSCEVCSRYYDGRYDPLQDCVYAKEDPTGPWQCKNRGEGLSYPDFQNLGAQIDELCLQPPNIRRCGDIEGFKPTFGY